MPSTLKPRRAKSPQTCDMVPGWLRTRSRRIVGAGIEGSRGAGAVMGGSFRGSRDHLAVGGAGGHHRVDVLLEGDRHADEARSAGREMAFQLRARIGGHPEIAGGDPERTREGREIRRGMEPGRDVTPAVEELLLLAHEAQVRVVEQQYLDVDLLLRRRRELL